MSQYQQRYFTKNNNSDIMEKAKRLASKERAKKRHTNGMRNGRNRVPNKHVYNSEIGIGKSLFFQLVTDKKIESITQKTREYKVKGERHQRHKPTFEEKGGFAARLVAAKNRSVRRCHRQLKIAARNGNLEMVHSMAKLSGVDINHADVDGRTALYYASAGNHSPVVRYLFSYPDIEPNKSDNYGISPLWIASHLGYPRVVSILIDWYGTNVNKTNPLGQTPLFAAVTNKNYPVICALLYHPRTNRHIAANNGDTPTNVATRKNYQYIMHALLFIVAPALPRGQRIRRSVKKRKSRGYE